MYDFFFSNIAETETFGRDLHQCFRRFLAELIILCSRCLGGIREVEQLVEHRIVSFSSGGYSKTCVKQPLSKRQKIGFQDQLSFDAGQKYCRMLQGEHSAILSTFIKLPFVIKIFVLSFFEWRFYTGFTVVGCTSIERYIIS